MPELTPESTPPPEAPAIVAPPFLNPESWEHSPCFRETFLAHFPIQEHNAAFRVLGGLVYDMVLEYSGYWPDHPEGWLRTSLRAAVADLRHVQGMLASLGEEVGDGGSTGEQSDAARLFLLAGSVAADVGVAADRIEAGASPWSA
jgi:hypothetical protein